MPKVEALFLKRSHASEINAVDHLDLLIGAGIVGDLKCDLESPRQILVVRAEDLHSFSLPLGYLKENMVLSGVSAYDFLPGRSIRFENGTSIHLVFHCEPCKKIGELVPRLSSISGKRGILGIVERSGRVHASDRPTFQPSCLNSMSESAEARVAQIVAKIPLGRVLDYGTLLVAAGLQAAYFRVIPKYLEAAKLANLPTHRVVTSAFALQKSDRLSHLTLAIELNHLLPAKESLGPFKRPEILPTLLKGLAWKPKILDLLQD